MTRTSNGNVNVGTLVEITGVADTTERESRRAQVKAKNLREPMVRNLVSEWL